MITAEMFLSYELLKFCWISSRESQLFFLTIFESLWRSSLFMKHSLLFLLAVSSVLKLLYRASWVFPPIRRPIIFSHSNSFNLRFFLILKYALNGAVKKKLKIITTQNWSLFIFYCQIWYMHHNTKQINTVNRQNQSIYFF